MFRTWTCLHLRGYISHTHRRAHSFNFLFLGLEEQFPLHLFKLVRHHPSRLIIYLNKPKTRALSTFPTQPQKNHHLSLPFSNIIQPSMSQEDYSKPRTNALSFFKDDFGDLQLPQHSKIHRQDNHLQPPGNPRQSKYQEDIDDDFLEIDLKAQSKFVSKVPETSALSSTNSSKSQKSETIKQQPLAIKNTASRIHRREKKPEVEKKQVNIDNQIGEVAEWAEKGAKNNSDQEDFNDNNRQKAAQSEEQLQIRRKIEEKLKSGFNTEKQGGGGGLRAKAEQLRKENQSKGKLVEIKEEASNLTSRAIDSNLDKKPKQADKYADKPQKIEENDHNTSGVQLAQKKKEEKPNIDLDDDDVDDHWNKINQQTINQITKVQQKRKNMNLQSVLEYFQKDFKFDEKDIDDEQVGNFGKQTQEQEQEESFLASLCSCFSSPKRSKQLKPNFALAKRLVAISKKQLSNGDEEYFLLKEIWTRLTGKEYSRYGAQWNQIGFQGRDPATDLRSTGILSLLQWLQFIETHPKLATKYYNWSLEYEYPLALTFIKLTGVFLDLLSKSAIKSPTWSGFQRSFNCLALGMFQKMMEKFKIGDTLGNFVQQQAKEIKSEYKKLFASYQQEFKKMK